MSDCCGMPRRAKSSGPGVSAYLAEERERRLAVKVEVEEAAHDRRLVAPQQRVVEADEVAGRLHVLLHDVHRQDLALRRRRHHERAQARFGEYASARHPKF